MICTMLTSWQTQNAFYSVKQLPSMPDRLRNSASGMLASRPDILQY